MLTRIIVGTLLSIAFIAIWYFGGIAQMIAFCIISLLCAYEMLNLMKKAGKNINPIPVYIGALAASPMLTYLNAGWYIALLFLCGFLTITLRIFNKNADNESMLFGLLTYIYPMGAVAVIIKLCSMGDLAFNRFAMLFTFASPLIADTLAYFFGVSMGKRKLCEHISPKKTIAGSIGAVVGGAVGGVGIYYLQPVIAKLFGTAALSYELLPLLILGLVMGITSQIGDLFASCIKRWAGVKDFGSIFPGHGGMLDRIDSVMMSAPFVLAAFELILN